MSSAVAATQKAVYVLLSDAWAERTPIQWPNVSFTPPDTAEGPSEWLKVDILWGDGEASTMGPVTKKRNTIAGVLLISGFTKKNAALGVLMGHLDAIRDVINRVEVNGVRFAVPSAPKRGEDPRWEMRQVSCGFTVDEVL